MIKGSAYVHLYKDGTVLLVHHGIEMGQGLHVKLQQICAEALGIPYDKVYCPINTAFLTPNAFVTGGSIGTDISGPAIVDACKKLLERLAPIKAKQPDAPWETIVGTAAMMGVSLSAMGEHQQPLTPNMHDNLYYNWNATVAEVELDVLTGHYKLIRVDCIQDVGKSLNPAVDIGQVEGGFIQGVGWLTFEDFKWAPNGKLLSNSENYEIPGFAEIPKDFRVTLLPNANCPPGIYSSKGIGEPPHLMGIAVVLALRKAIASIRKDLGLPEWIQLILPCTPDKLQLACGDVLKHLKKPREPKPEE